MVYHAQPELSARDALLRAAIYVPLCFGVKALVDSAFIRRLETHCKPDYDHRRPPRL